MLNRRIFFKPDSLDLSLLIQNKGKGSLDVNIVAPDFVSLEQNTVQLKAKENKEVRLLFPCYCCL